MAYIFVVPIFLPFLFLLFHNMLRISLLLILGTGAPVAWAIFSESYLILTLLVFVSCLQHLLNCGLLRLYFRPLVCGSFSLVWLLCLSPLFSGHVCVHPPTCLLCVVTWMSGKRDPADWGLGRLECSCFLRSTHHFWHQLHLKQEAGTIGQCVQGLWNHSKGVGMEVLNCPLSACDHLPFPVCNVN